MKFKIVYIFLFFIIILISLLFLFPSDIVRYKFNDFNEVRESGLIEKGWIPKIIPSKLNNFKILYDIDTNRICGSYTYVSEPIIIGNNVIELKIREDTMKLVSNFIALYCPENQHIIKIQSNRLDLYKNGSFLFIIEQKSKQVIFIDGYL